MAYSVLNKMEDKAELNVDNYFDPVKNNVAFGTVIDGWGFRVFELAQFYAKKWEMNADKLSQFFFGEYYLNLKQKKLSKKEFIEGQKNIFTQYSIYPISLLYQAQKENDFEKIKDIA